MPEITPKKNFRLHLPSLNLRKIDIRSWECIMRGEKINQFVSLLVPDLEKKNLISRRTDLKIILNSFTYI